MVRAVKGQVYTDDHAPSSRRLQSIRTQPRGSPLLGSPQIKYLLLGWRQHPVFSALFVIDLALALCYMLRSQAPHNVS